MNEDNRILMFLNYKIIVRNFIDAKRDHSQRGLFLFLSISVSIFCVIQGVMKLNTNTVSNDDNTPM